jgi:hypothetical protein
MKLEVIRIAFVAEGGIMPQSTISAWEQFGLALSGPLAPAALPKGFERLVDGIVFDDSCAADQRVALEQLLRTYGVPFTSGAFLTRLEKNCFVSLPRASDEIGFLVWKIFNQAVGGYH